MRNKKSKATKYKSVADYLANTKKVGPCRIWLGRVNNKGYGVVGSYHPKHVDKLPTTVHRRVFYLAYGTRPPVVMHKCDVRNCINPRHLIGGSQQDNIKDAARKGRLFGNSKHFVNFNGKRITLHRLSTITGVPHETLYWRHKHNRKLLE